MRESGKPFTAKEGELVFEFSCGVDVLDYLEDGDLAQDLGVLAFADFGQD